MLYKKGMYWFRAWQINDANNTICFLDRTIPQWVIKATDKKLIWKHFGFGICYISGEYGESSIAFTTEWIVDEGIFGTPSNNRFKKYTDEQFRKLFSGC